MKFLLYTLISLFFVACHTQKEIQTPAPKPIQALSVNDGKTEGVVSFKNKKDGCGTIVIIQSEGSEQILIPKSGLAPEFDKDGLHIKFNYRKLRVPSPLGCEFGGMVELSEVEKK